METNHQKEALAVIRTAGAMDDSALNLIDLALAFAVLDRPQMDPMPYRAHLDALVLQIRAAAAAVPLNDLEGQMHALRRVLVIEHKYQGDTALSDDPQDANLMQVIDRRQGVAPALGIIYLHVAAQMGWSMIGLDYAGHFLVRLVAAQSAVILDPARAGQTCSAETLRELGARLGVDAETEGEDDEDPFEAPSYALVMSKRDILLRLQNNLKRRLLSRNKLDAAITTLQGMILLAPKRQTLWRELGYLQAERGSLRAAITALEVVKDLADEPLESAGHEALLRQLRWQLN